MTLRSRLHQSRLPQGRLPTGRLPTGRLSAGRLSAALGGAAVVALALTGCVANNPGGSDALSVAITDDTCAVSANTSAAGPVAFELNNTGSDVNEFEILADDKLRIVGEKENVTPGQVISYVAHLDPGTYYTACKFRQAGSPIGLAEFTVTGEADELTGDQQARLDEAVANYVSYITSQVDELVPAAAALAEAYRNGYDDTARSLFASTRVFYERIEPTAEAFGDLDPKIDYREVDAVAEELDWTGFHRIEKDLWAPQPGDLNSDGTDAFLDWAPSTPDERVGYAQGLVDSVHELQDLVNAPDFSVTLSAISNGAIALLDEVAAGKITGEEDWWSHTDLYDFAANVQGAEVAFGTVKSIAAASGDEGAALVTEIQTEFDALDAALAQYGSLESGFVSYDEVTDSQRKVLSDQVNALSEPLSRLTSTVLGA